MPTNETAPMKLWIAERTDSNDYDEYSEIVFRAESEDAAHAMLMDAPNYFNDKMTGEPYEGFREGNFTIKPLTEAGEPGYVIGSFHAG